VDREFLLLLLVFGVLLNTGLLVTVAVLRAARVGEAPAAPGVPRVTVIPQQTLAPSRGPSSENRARRAPAPSVGRTPALVAEVAEAPAPLREVAAPPSPAPTVPSPAPAGATTPARATATRRTGRPRRFTMPNLEEDHDRATRSIAAFLGEPVAPTPGAHPQRRRHRARRPAGAAVRSDVVLLVAGDPPGGRIAHAVAAALRDTVRASDEVVELPGGRLRVTLDADAAGAEAFAARARAVVRPWLDLVGPGVELRVESGVADHPATAAS
jgi:hypothetical protein